MLRKIDTHLLQPGMFLQELCGTWIDHPFWRTSFKLKDAGEIAKIINSGIKEALIDTDKGLDVEVATVEVATVDAPPPVQARPPAAPQPAKAARPAYTRRASSPNRKKPSSRCSTKRAWARPSKPTT